MHTLCNIPATCTKNINSCIILWSHLFIHYRVSPITMECGTYVCSTTVRMLFFVVNLPGCVEKQPWKNYIILKFCYAYHLSLNNGFFKFYQFLHTYIYFFDLYRVIHYIRIVSFNYDDHFDIDSCLQQFSNT